jgi:hypothetical protein
MKYSSDNCKYCYTFEVVKIVKIVCNVNFLLGKEKPWQERLCFWGNSEVQGTSFCLQP